MKAAAVGEQQQKQLQLGPVFTSKAGYPGW
jgi:hypothetical protein